MYYPQVEWGHFDTVLESAAPLSNMLCFEEAIIQFVDVAWAVILAINDQNCLLLLCTYIMTHIHI